MASKDSIWGVFSPKKLNPNLIVLSLTIIVVTLIFVYSGRHNKITLPRWFTIETNIPGSPENQKAAPPSPGPHPRTPP